MILKTAYQLVQNSGQKRPKSRLRKFSKRDARALDAIKSSGAYDQGGITSEADMDAKGMFVGDGLPVGTKNGRVLKDNSDAPIAILSRPGGGKGTCLGFPMMAEWRHSSLIIDVDYSKPSQPRSKPVVSKNPLYNRSGNNPLYKS